MRHARAVLSAFLAALLVVACAPAEETPEPTVDTEAEAETIMELESEWSDRFQEGDIDWIVNRHAADGRALPPGSGPVVGREAVRQFWTGMYETEGLSLTFGPDEVHVDDGGSMAYALGSYEMGFPDGSEDRGKYVVVWVKRGGEWRIAVDMFNSNVSPE